MLQAAYESLAVGIHTQRHIAQNGSTGVYVLESSRKHDNTKCMMSYCQQLIMLFGVTQS